MDLAGARQLIEDTLERMRTAYGDEVFDEWAIISVGDGVWNVEAYSGPRSGTFVGNLPEDLKPLADTSTGKAHAIGDFEFAANAPGTRHDAMLRLGPTTYLVCNNTTKTIAEIRARMRWLATQRFFVGLSETVHADPLTLGE